MKDVNGDDNIPLLQFGQTLLEGTPAMDWLYAYRGQLKVSATLFQVGVHYAKCPKHFISIVEPVNALLIK